MHSFLVVPLSLVPQWTQQNVPFFDMVMRSNDGLYLLLDNAHPESTFRKWLGPNADTLPSMLASSTIVTHEELLLYRRDPESIWFLESKEE